MRKKIYDRITLAYFIAVAFLAPWLAKAQLPYFPCPPGLACPGTVNLSVNDFLMRIITWLLGFAFGLAVLFLIIGGFWYITSGGNEESADKGKKTVINAIIGIIIIILSYVIISVIVNMLARSTTPATTP